MDVSSVSDLCLSNYQRLLFQDENVNACESADIQRKCIAQLLNASCKSLSNSNTCNLLDSKLSKYSDSVILDNKNIYDDRLKSLLSQSNKSISKDFKCSLDKINVNSLIKPLPCSNSKYNYCEKSETPSESEFVQFLEAFHNKEQTTTPYHPQRNPCKERPPFKNDTMRYPETNRPSEICKENNYRKSINDSTRDTNCKNYPSSFKTAQDELLLQNMKKYGNTSGQQNTFSANNVQGSKKKLGTRRNINSKFISPILSNNESNEDIKSEEWIDVDERLKNIDPKMVELIKSEIMDCGPNIHWNDIAGLAFAKTAIQEAVVWPMLRPDIFTGLRRPPKGILLFGPPGTGKTLIGKCVASQSKSTFFSISASSLTSKWIGDGEKMVRALFTVARVHQPAVIFIDEIDSLLSQRSDTEHESSRRLKTEFLVQLDGATTDNDERILVIGATNRPQELDEAARRRFVKRLYIPLPDFEARLQLVNKLISTERHHLSEEDFKGIASLSDGYSGADIRTLCSEASLGPIRSIDMNLIEHIQATEVRPLEKEDFEKAFSRVRSSVSPKDLEQYISWDKTFGSGNGF